jgi:alkanesulfonate monooxygenase SsuD/methylene tetrahydromethanopterin reductase-like flavin-dependent oxidoreductase (luciferase family)
VTDYLQQLQFGIFPTPNAADADRALELAMLADVTGLDLVSVQDHPYQARFLDTWTLLSVIAARTSSVRVAPNVANLPLRPPVVLARSVASLDILTGGRVELGLGAGAFWDAIVAVGGNRLSPPDSVDALAEAIDVIRAVWDTSARSIRHQGKHYRVVGAHPGPAPAHPVEIWVGAYGPRMLRLTGRVADGWLPSQGYAGPALLPAMNEVIDRAASAAGRDPAGVRRMYNINGSFGSGAEFLAGRPRDWADQLAELTLSTGMSTYILATDDPDTVRAFAAEVAPAVRELVDAERGRREAMAAQRARPAAAGTPSGDGISGTDSDVAAAQAGTEPDASTAPRPASAVARTPLGVRPTPDPGRRRSSERPWDESNRPSGPAPDPERRYTEHEQAAGQHLVDIHDALRAELTQLHDVIGQVQRGQLDAGAARSVINEMTMRQNNWTLGAFCQSYCRIVAGHHSLEDRSVFPHLRRRDARLGPVLDRLAEEHEVIAGVLDRVDRGLVALITRDDGMADLQAAVDLLDDTLLSHLSYEERELVEPLARFGYY